MKLQFIFIVCLIIVGCNSNPSAEKDIRAAAKNEIVQESTPTSTNKVETAEVVDTVVVPEGIEINDWTIVPGKQVGAINRYSSYETLVEAYGKENVKNTVFTVYEGVQKSGTLIFPDTENEVEILWKDDQNKKQPIQLSINGKNSKWETYHGIKVGTTLKELNKINAKPFKFLGFEYIYQNNVNYSGLVSNWNKGRIDNYLGMVLLAKDKSTKEHPNYQDFLGGIEYNSDSEGLKPLNIGVHEIRVTFP